MEKKIASAIEIYLQKIVLMHTKICSHNTIYEAHTVYSVHGKKFQIQIQKIYIPNIDMKLSVAANIFLPCI